MSNQDTVLVPVPSGNDDAMMAARPTAGDLVEEVPKAMMVLGPDPTPKGTEPKAEPSPEPKEQAAVARTPAHDNLTIPSREFDIMVARLLGVLNYSDSDPEHVNKAKAVQRALAPLRTVVSDLVLYVAPTPDGHMFVAWNLLERLRPGHDLSLEQKKKAGHGIQFPKHCVAAIVSVFMSHKFQACTVQGTTVLVRPSRIPL